MVTVDRLLWTARRQSFSMSLNASNIELYYIVMYSVITDFHVELKKYRLSELRFQNIPDIYVSTFPKPAVCQGAVVLKAALATENIQPYSA